MADWLAPFHLPKFTDAKFKKMREAYVKKHGYTITVPVFDDIIKWKLFKPMTEEEKKAWKKKDFSKFPLARLQEIMDEKASKKAKFIAMLADPSPEILSAAGAIMTSLDDAQDALSTLAVIGMITAAVVGGTTASLLAGPVGVLAGAAALLNLLNPLGRLKGLAGKAKTGRGAKKDLEKFSDKNPYSKKAKANMIKKMKKFRPGFSNAIEALQVSAGIFGIGVSIGPIMGFVQGYLSGLVRKAAGQKVQMTTNPHSVPAHVELAQRTLKSQAVMHGYPWKSILSDEMASIIACNLSRQVIEPYLTDWNPFDQVDDLENVMIKAPRPTDILTLEVIEEAGKNLEDICNWPQNGQPWISLGALQESTASTATENLTHFAQENAHDPMALVTLQNAHDFALGTIEAIEGPGHVYIEYSAIERIVIIVLDNGWMYPDDITDAQVVKFEDWCYVHDYMNTVPTATDIFRYAEVFCGFTWARSPDEYR